MASMLTADGKCRVQVYGSTISGNRKYKTEITKLDHFLQADEIPYEFIDIASNEEAKAYMRRKTKVGMVLPQVFCDGEFRATFEEVAEAVEIYQLRGILGLEDDPVNLDDLSDLNQLTEEQLAQLSAEIEKAPAKVPTRTT
ncbi:hypothetical protein IWQ62_004301 [Dispira parvispora]|uniref:Glutaredoxin n=1 Tax=Dispira parvispora TaxID=1520584 RepID=A0A9W8AT55_9FUNG|nr:hypothetical protein IWQ62_004301 [Dispira parvispora]